MPPAQGDDTRRCEEDRTIVPNPGAAAQAKKRTRPAHVTRDLTRGSIPANLWFLSWPQIIEASLNVLDQLADLFWAGRLGYRAIAGLGVAQTYTQLVMMVRQGLDLAMRAAISRAVGAGNILLANHVALQGLALSILYAVVVNGSGVVLTELLLRTIGISEEVRAQAMVYMQVQFIARAVMGLRTTGGAMLQSAGDAVTPMRATMVMRPIHLVLSPFLVFGWWWFPTVGLPGAALADLLAQLVGSALVYGPLLKGSSRLHLTFRGYKPDFPLMRRLVRIGIPGSVAAAERGFAHLVLLGFVAPFGDLSVAAFSITRRMETMAHGTTVGFGRASGTLIGQNLGAGQPERAKQTLAWALALGTAVNLAVGLVVILFPTPIVAVFNREPEFLEVGSAWLQIRGLAFMLMAPAFIFQQSFNIAGDTLGVLVVTLIGFWGFQIPLAWGLSRYTGLEEYGIAWAIVIAMAVRIALFVPYAFWGRWLRVKVV